MNTKLRNGLYKYKLHILIWALFIFYECVVIGMLAGAFGHPLTYAGHYSIIITLFYVHAKVSLPWAMKKKNSAFLKVLVVATIEISMYILLSLALDKLLVFIQILPHTAWSSLNYVYVLRNLYRCIYFMGFSTGYYYLMTYNDEKRKTAELERLRLNGIISAEKAGKELMRAQNAYLKAQINPHFLFNTLDFIYHHVMSSSPPAAEAIIVLSEMMRYAIDSDQIQDFILVKDEIEQIENIRYLNQLRKEKPQCIRFIFDENVKEIHLVPLVLLTLAENIFKHGNLTQEDNFAELKIFLDNDTLKIYSDNLISSQKHISHQTGLKNIEKRLKYAYGNDITFQHQVDSSNHFRMRIAIPLETLQQHALKAEI